MEGKLDAIFFAMGEHNNIFLDSLAPETISNRPHNESSAVYSLGILTIILLKGESPFKELSPSKISQERERFIENLDDNELPFFLKDMMQMNVHMRPNLRECTNYYLKMITDLNNH